MAVEINIPKLGMTMSEAKVVEWKAKEGDWTEKGSIVLSIETEKITWEVEQLPLVSFTLWLKRETLQQLVRLSV